MHVATAALLIALGAALLLAKYYGSDEVRHYTVLVIGALLVLTGVLALWPILTTPVVDAESSCC
jgi:hypothetical protein